MSFSFTFDSNTGHVTIAEGSTEIPAEAFSGRNEVRSVSIPYGVTTIGSRAFISNQLTSIDIPESVTTIGASAFNGNQLTSVVIGDGVTSIGDYAFDRN